MPVLEAMAAGIPVACFDIPPLRQIADGCAVFFNPNDEAAMGRAMQQVLEDCSLVEAAQCRAKQFTWKNAAQATLDYLKRSSS